MDYNHRFVKNNKNGKITACWDTASRCFAIQVVIQKIPGEDASWGQPYRFAYENIGDVLYYFESIGIKLPQHIIQSLLRDRLEDERQHREIARNTPVTTLRVTAAGVAFD
ncbi:MAG: hypothetical protein ABIL58_16175 [Pseudomonadota bacterium]